MAIEAGLTKTPLNISPSTGVGGSGVGSVKGPKVDGGEFKRALEQFSQVQNAEAMNPLASSGLDKLKFSNHAIERMRSRGISFQPDTMKDIEGAIQKAAAKGSKDTLILAGESALIVSVKNNTVVTVMDRQAMKDNVFTNIDSTVVL